VVLVVIRIDPAAGGSAVQVISNATVAVSPLVTVTSLETSAMLQFSATPDSRTVYSPGARLFTVSLPSTPMARSWPPSIENWYPFGS
jgi:hypothetical protein